MKTGRWWTNISSTIIFSQGGSVNTELHSPMMHFPFASLPQIAAPSASSYWDLPFIKLQYIQMSWEERKNNFSPAADDWVVIVAIKGVRNEQGCQKDVPLLADRGRCLSTYPRWQTAPGASTWSLCSESCLPDGHRSPCPEETHTHTRWLLTTRKAEKRQIFWIWTSRNNQSCHFELLRHVALLLFRMARWLSSNMIRDKHTPKKVMILEAVCSDRKQLNFLV